MQVFKAYLIILRKNWILILVYFTIFASISLLFNASTKEDSYTITKVNATLINNDTSTFSKSFEEYISQYITPVSIGNQTIDDALFYQDIEIYIEIPKNFTSDLFNKAEKLIVIQTTPSSLAASQISTLITSYLNMSKHYVESGLSSLETVGSDVSKVLKDSTSSSEVTIEASSSNNSMLVSFYNYAAYLISALLLTIVGVVMISFKSKEIKRRMNICAISNSKITLTLIAANLLLGVLLPIILTVISIILYPDEVGMKTFYFLLNMIIFSIVFVVLSYLLSMSIKSKEVYSALSVLLPLAGGFLGGVFLPSEFINSNILFVSKLLPPYWFTLNNSFITKNNFNFFQFMQSCFPQFIFIAVFTIATVVIMKLKNREE